jgi:ABC-type transport system involved in multi-copper enzyme maturation permease subunit
LTVLDLVRRRLLVVLGLFAVAMILLSFPLRVLTTGEWHRVISDVGLGAADLSVTLIAILLGATLVAGDLERRTLYPLLARPLTRSAFVVGKVLGLSLVLAFLAAVMGGGTALMLRLAKEPGMIPLVQATCTIAVGAILVGSLAVMFSSFTSSTLAGIFGLAVVLLGHLTENMAYFGARAQTELSRAILLGFSKALPDLERLNLKTMASHGNTVSWKALALLAAYGFAYSVVATSLGAAVFSRRDLK